MSFLVVFLFVAAHSTLGQVLDTDQVPDGTPTFTYYDAIAKAAAAKLQKFLTDLDDGLDQCLVVEKTFNNASLALKQYNALAVLLNATKCAVPEEDKNHFSGTQAAIEAIVKTCFAFVPQNFREILRKNIIDSVAEIQSLDNSLRQNAFICFSLRVPEPDSCVDGRTEIIKNVNSTVSFSELTRFGFLVRSGYFSGMGFAERCTEVATTEQRTELDAWIKKLVDCQSTL